MRMKTVAHWLQVETFKRGDHGEKDDFGRSAYNRYYYAAYLAARRVLKSIYGEGSQFDHANLPNYLETTVKNDIKKVKNDAKRTGDQELSDQCGRANNAALELAKIFRAAYAVRVTADYQPEVRVTFLGADRFTLNGVDISRAHEWPDQVEFYASQIQSVSRSF
ncbi:MAG: hypothetical protein ABIN69_13785 [Aestuariivirga sp.]